MNGLKHMANGQEEKSGSDPYTSARREWNERYGNYIARARMWQLMAFLSAFTSVIAVIGLAYIGSQSKFIPYIVQVDQLGQAAVVGRADRAGRADTRVIRATLASWVTDWRTVMIDVVAQKQTIYRVYDLLPVSSAANKKVSDWFSSEPPFEKARTRTISVQVVSVLPITDQSWQIEWVETWRTPNGELVRKPRFRGTLSVTLNPPTDEAGILRNPLGVYVNDVSWNEIL